MAEAPLNQAEMRALMAFALRHLPTAERNVLRRRFGIHAPGEAWSHSRIAGDLGLTVAQVRFLEDTALRRLRGLRDRGAIAFDPPTTNEEGADDEGARPAD